MRQELAALALAEVARLERLERCSLTPKDETSTGVLLCGKLHEELEEVARMVETLAPLSDATASPVDDLLEYDGELWKLCTHLTCTRRCAGRKCLRGPGESTNYTSSVSFTAAQVRVQ